MKSYESKKSRKVEEGMEKEKNQFTRQWTFFWNALRQGWYDLDVYDFIISATNYNFNIFLRK